MPFQWSKPDLPKYFDLPNPGLRAYFLRTVEGNAEIYRPPFWHKERPTLVVQRWKDRLLRTGVADKYPSLYKFELEMKDKVGPMSYQKPLKDRLKHVEEYYTGVELPSEPISEEAVQQAADYFYADVKLNLRSQEETWKRMRKSTNSGPPFFTTRNSVVNKTVPLSVVGDKQILPYGEYELAAVLGFRGQEGGPRIIDTKNRDVWMMSLGQNVKELQYYQVDIEHIQKHNLIPAYVSNDLVDETITKAFAYKRTSDQVICTDFKGMDQHFNGHMQDAAYTITKYGLADTAESREWLRTIFPLKYNIPLICSEDLMISGPHGMGSGSGGTNDDETKSHTALQFEAGNSEHVSGRLNPYCQRYGDDGYIVAPGLEVDDVIRSYTRHGQVMNPDKQYVSTHDCVFLRRWHGMEYRVNGIMVGVYSTFRALGRLLFQERWYDPETWGPKMVILRAWSILENCKFHPCFEEFVDFCMEGDKYRLGLLIPGFLDDVASIAQEAIDHIPDFLGYTKTLQGEGASGITNWRIYQYLRSLA